MRRCTHPRWPLPNFDRAQTISRKICQKVNLNTQVILHTRLSKTSNEIYKKNIFPQTSAFQRPLEARKVHWIWSSRTWPEVVYIPVIAINTTYLTASSITPYDKYTAPANRKCADVLIPGDLFQISSEPRQFPKQHVRSKSNHAIVTISLQNVAHK